VVLGNAGRVSEAVFHLQRALLLRPDYPEAHENLGKVLVFLGRTAEGRAHLQEAARLRNRPSP
jgi:Flp pilus assembly protein TadD